MISTVVFDFDGTLVDSNAIKRQGFFDVVAEHPGGPLRMEKVLSRIEGDRHAVFAAYVADAAKSACDIVEPAEKLVRKYSGRVDALVTAAREMPGATSLLRELRRYGRRLYLSSATPVNSLHSILEQREWLRLFEDVFGYPASKRDSIMRVRDLTGIHVASLAVVGDGGDDRDAAASIGCVFFPVGEARGSSKLERVFTLSELLQVLLSRSNGR